MLLWFQQVVTPEMTAVLKQLRQVVNVGIVGGSDLQKQMEQLGDSSMLMLLPVYSCFIYIYKSRLNTVG